MRQILLHKLYLDAIRWDWRQSRREKTRALVEDEIGEVGGVRTKEFRGVQPATFNRPSV
jgi:hypothetical protein